MVIPKGRGTQPRSFFLRECVYVSMANNSNYSILSGSAGKGETSLSIDIPYPVENNNFIVWLILPTGEVVQGSGSYDNGRISITNKIDTSDEWGAIVYRAETAELNATLKSSGEVSLSDIIAQFSKNVRVLEQLETLVKTSVRAVDEIVPLPNETKRAGNFLSFDTKGNPVANVAVQTLKDTLQGAKDAIAEAQAWAIGDENDAETKNNNAKYYAETAQASALSSSSYTIKARAWAIGDENDAETKNNNARHYADSARGFVNGFDGEVDKATITFNKNASDKKDEFDKNCETKKGEINQIALDVNSKVDGFDSKVDEATSDFNSNASGVLSQVKGYATEAKNARDEAVEIVDPEGWRTGTRAMIDSLAVAKANRGEFWFECGALTTTNKMPLKAPFTCVWTMAMTQEEFLQHKTYFPKIIGNIGYWADTGYGWCVNSIGGTSIGVGANNVGGAGKDYKTLDIKNYLDGNPHIWTVVYNGTNISLYIDNVKKTSLAFTFESSEATNPLGIGSTPTSTNQNYGVWGKIYRIKYFNFDMYADDAPYKIADYISGKDESPLLYGGAYNINSQSDWLAFHSNEGTFASTGNDLTYTASEDSTAGYLVFYVNANVKAGTKVEALIDSVVNNTSATISKYSISAGATSTNDAGSSPSSTTLFGTQTSFTTTKDSNKLAFWIWKTGTFATGETLTLVNPQIRVNGALLSLDDVKSGVQVLDKSGNGNHANISGLVCATKENNPARCVDSASFSWAGTATTQKFANSDVAIPANSKVVAYAKANVGMSASFTCGSNSAVSKELSANTLTEIGSFLNASQGAFKVTPSSAITGKMDVYLTIEKF